MCEKLFETANQLSSHGCANKSQKENSQSQQLNSDPEEKCLKTYTNQNGRNIKKRKVKVKVVKTKSETDPIIQSCPECNMKFRNNHKLRYGYCNNGLMNSGTFKWIISGITVLVSCSEYPRHKPFLLTPVLKQK